MPFERGVKRRSRSAEQNDGIELRISVRTGVEGDVVVHSQHPHWPDGLRPEEACVDLADLIGGRREGAVRVTRCERL